MGMAEPFPSNSHDGHDGTMDGVSRVDTTYCIRSPRGAIDRSKSHEFFDVLGFHTCL
jgi:hypothetical protein